MRQWTVDAFASQPFRGNPACVVEPLGGEWPHDDWMQALASENNQAETAFLQPMGEPGRYRLRWFTPALEVPLCGHATLASAHVLYSELGEVAEEITFETLSGDLRVRQKGGLYEMDFPADPPWRTPVPAGFAEALGVQPAEVWAGSYLVAILDSEAAVRSLNPDIAALGAIGGEATRGPGNIIVAALSDGPGQDVVDRFFGPGCGIPEDPTTGSAHCILGPLYAEKLGRPTVRFLQAYPGRGGELETETAGARVLIRGRAVTVIESRLRL
jgi:PhzF family phenazine biosynthesis protein